MAYDKISISLPPGYERSLDEEAQRYGFTRSEFVRVLFDGYLSVVARQIARGEQEPRLDHETGLPDFFHDVFPHRKAEAHRWLHDYLHTVTKIVLDRKHLKGATGQVDRDSVWEGLMHDSQQSDAA